MRVSEAKDFVVGQTAEQARLEGIALSDLEKRMMYFAENDASSCANPFELNQEFQAKHDAEQYETKISSLLHHAHKRLKSEDPKKAQHWDQAFRALGDGDHYLSILWNTQSGSEYPLRGSVTPLRDSFPLLAAGLLVATVVILAVLFAAKYGITLSTVLGTILTAGLATGHGCCSTGYL